ncbi:hypothetical protein HZB60_06970 [candidate division KSB1 bacterium]|nr:hypothetical protein [candidate division KSB1 bacterium]
MVLFVSYALVTAAVLWSTLWFLPSEVLRQHLSFSFNILQLGLLSLLSFMCYRQELHYRTIFFHFWILFAVLGLSAPAFYHFQFLTSFESSVSAFVLILVVTHLLFAWVAAKTVSTYIFRDEKRWAVNTLAAAVVLPLCAWWFWPYYWSPEVVLAVQSANPPVDIYAPIARAIIKINMISLVILVAFFWHKLKTDRPIGAYADTLVFLFTLVVLIDTLEYVAQVTSVELLSITQWATAGIFAAMTATLLLRLKYKTQTIAQYYETQLLSSDPRIDRRIGWFDRFIIRSFFDPEKVGQSVFLGTGNSQVKVKRSSLRVKHPLGRD